VKQWTPNLLMALVTFAMASALEAVAVAVFQPPNPIPIVFAVALLLFACVLNVTIWLVEMGERMGGRTR
jgi:hypothetical protein